MRVSIPSVIISGEIDMARIKYEDVIPILQELIRIKTENPPGTTRDAVDYLAELFQNAGIKYSLQEYAPGHVNIIAEYGDPKESIILTGHLDTVPAGDEQLWKHNPFEGQIENDKLYGRGATDMKSAVAAFVAVMNWLKKSEIKLDKRIVFLGTADEETGMDGAYYAKKQGIMENCEFVVIGEPTDLHIAVAEKGVLWIEVQVNGKAAHGSTPELGTNAIEEAAKLIPKMHSAVPKDLHPVLKKSTLNIGKIFGGTAINVVPERCSFQCDYRVTPNVDAENVWKTIVQLIEEFNRESPATVTVRKIHQIKAIEAQHNNALLTKFKAYANKIGKKTDLGVTYGTDGAMLIPDYNTPFVICGPGHLDKLHVVDECVDIQQVIDYANMILEILLSYAKEN